MLEFLEDGLFLSEVFELLGIQQFVLLGAVSLEDAESSVEALLCIVHLMLVGFFVATVFEEGLVLLVHVLFVELHKTNANGGDFVLDLVYIRFLDNLLEHGGQFILGLSFNIKFHFLSLFLFHQILVGNKLRKFLILGNHLLRFLVKSNTARKN